MCPEITKTKIRQRKNTVFTVESFQRNFRSNSIQIILNTIEGIYIYKDELCGAVFTPVAHVKTLSSHHVGGFSWPHKSLPSVLFVTMQTNS